MHYYVKHVMPAHKNISWKLKQLTYILLLYVWLEVQIKRWAGTSPNLKIQKLLDTDES